METFWSLIHTGACRKSPGSVTGSASNQYKLLYCQLAALTLGPILHLEARIFEQPDKQQPLPGKTACGSTNADALTTSK